MTQIRKLLFSIIGMAVIYFSLFLSVAQASVTTVSFWRMGEDDPGVASGVATNTTDPTGLRTIKMVGSPSYSTSVSSSASTNAGSAWCMTFVSGSYGTNAVIPSLTNNFGVELWVKPDDTTGNKCLIYNGDGGFNGWGLLQNGATYQALFGGIVYVGSGTATAGTWAHVAVVRNNGTNTLYVNGVAAGASGTEAPNPAVGFCAVAAGAPNTAGDRFLGSMDEVRVFTFAPGAFSTNDLLLNPHLPVVSTLPATSVGSVSATLNATVNPNGFATAAYFQYGTTTNYGSFSATNSLTATNSILAVSNLISGLSAGTLYHFRVTATNGSGITVGSDLTFTTGTVAPTATTLGATVISATDGILNATVNPNGSATAAYFQYGTTTNYGSFSATNNLAATNITLTFSNLISGLAPSLYHFRIVAANSAATSVGSDLTFTIGSGAAIVTAPTATSISPTNATLNGLVNPLDQATTVYLRYSTNANFWDGIISNPSFEANSYGTYPGYASDNGGVISGWHFSSPNSIGLNPAGGSSFFADNGATPDGTNVAFIQGNHGTYSISTTISNLTVGMPYQVSFRANCWTGNSTFSSYWSLNGGLNMPFTASPPVGGTNPYYTNSATFIATSSTAALLLINSSPTDVSAVLLDAFSIRSLFFNVTNSLAATNANVAVSNVITGLQPGTTYYFQIVASNSLGIANGPIGTFTTVGVPTVTTLAASGIGVTNATLNGTVHLSGGVTAAYFEYGTHNNYGNFSATNILTATNTTLAISNLVNNLLGDTLYHFRLVAGNMAGTNVGADFTFNTMSGAPSAVTVSSSNVTKSSTLLNGLVNAEGVSTGYYFQYGTTTNYGLSTTTTTLLPEARDTLVNASINVLPDTLYHFRLVATNSLGTNVGADFTFLAGVVPTVVSLPATNIALTSATLTGILNANDLSGSYFFQYGTSTNYSGSTAVVGFSASDNQPLSSPIGGLSAGTLYHFRLVAYNDLGTNTGADLTFLTGLPPVSTTLPATNVTPTVTTAVATLQGVVNGGGLPTGYYFQYGTNINYSDSTTSTYLPAGTNDVAVNTLISGLSAATLYHFHIVAFNALGTNAGADLTFTTGVAPTATTSPDVDVKLATTTAVATLQGVVNGGDLPTGYYFQYGTNTNYSNSTTLTYLPGSTNDVPVNTGISGLATDTLYHFRLVATNGLGTSAGNDVTFVTRSSIPAVTTLPATGISNTVAQLNGTISPNGQITTYYFEYGTNGFSSTNTIAADVFSTAVSVSLNGLTPGAIYRARLVAANGAGVARGRDILFSAPSIALNSPDIVTNECHFSTVVPTATASGPPLAIAAGQGEIMVLKSDGKVRTWGNPSLTNVPATLSNVVAIAAGQSVNLALKSDGTVAVWGGSTYDLNKIPVGLSNVVALSAGNGQTLSPCLALKSDGTVVAWGTNSTTFGTNSYGRAVVPPGLSNVVDISSGYSTSLALKKDGTVTAWPSWQNYPGGFTTVPADWTNVVAISGGNLLPIAVKSDGTVSSIAPGGGSFSAFLAGLSNVVAIAQGDLDTLALRKDGTVAGYTDPGYPTNTIPALTNVVAIGVGFGFATALQSDGRVVAWGFNGSSATNVPTGLNTLNMVTTTITNTLDTNSPGTSTVTQYTCTNFPGAIAVVRRTVIVKDTLPPAIALLGNNPLTNGINVPILDPGVNASLDLCDGSYVISTNSDVNISVPGVYSINYTVADSSSNATNAVRTVVVVAPPAVSSFVVTPFVTNGVLGTKSMQLAASITPNGLPATVFFQYGLTTAYGATSDPILLPSGFSPLSVTVLATGLQPTSFHWRVVATNSYGSTLGPDQTFTIETPGGLPGDLNGDGIVSQNELDAVYGNYVTNSPWLYMTNLAGLGETNVSFALDNSVSGSYTVDYSTNLTDWFPLGSATPRYLFTDTNAPALPQRYYRLRYP